MNELINKQNKNMKNYKSTNTFNITEKYTKNKTKLNSKITANSKY